MRKTSLILIIEDDANFSRMFVGMLEADGFSVLQATCGPDGRQLASTRKPDLILLDRQMPEEDGMETCRKLKTDPQTSQIPIIFVTAGQDLESKVAAFESGAVDYITKPYAWAEVRARVRLHLQLHHAHQNLIESHASRLGQLAATQESMLILPKDAAAARFSVCRRPLHEVGGDFYDVVPIADHIWDYIVADVAGHDLESSLVTSALMAIVRQNANILVEPAQMVQLINSVLLRVYPEGPYVTMAYARLNRSRMTMNLVLAGHPPVIRTCHDGRVETHFGAGDLLGAFESVSVAEFTIRLAPGDRLHFYTDGLIEADSAGPISRTEGLARLTRLCAKHQDQPLEATANLLVDGMMSRTCTASDDLMLLAIDV